MNTDKKELSEAYKELRKIIGVQDFEKWAADNSKARLEEVKALIKRATQEGQEAALRYDDFKELDRLFVTREITQEEYENNPQKIAYKAYIGEIQIKVKELDIVCLLQAILPPKNLPAYKRATDAAIKKAEKIIKEIHKETSCSAKTLTFLSGLLIQNITYLTHYVYHQKEHDAFLKGLAAFQKQIDEVMKQVTHPLKDEKNDHFYKERDRIAAEMDKLSVDHIQTIYNYSKANRIAADIVSKLYPGQEIIPAETPKEIEGFYLLAQSPISNQLTKKLTERIAKPAQFDLYGNASIIGDDFRLFVKGYAELLNGVKDTAAMLLDSLMITATKKGMKDTLVVLPLNEYMEMRGLKDEKETRRQVKRDINALERISFEYKGTGKNKGAWLNVSIYGGTKGQIKNGDIVFRFNQDFFDSFKEGAGNKYLFMYFPHEALTGRIKENPWKFWLGRQISLHKRMNIGKPNEDTISVQTLIEACPNYPTYEKVMNEDRAISRRIIEPFDRDLTALEPSITWEYQGLSESPQTYQEFINAKIIIHWATYPDTTKLSEEKKKRARKIAQIKQKNGKKRGGETQQKGG